MSSGWGIAFGWLGVTEAPRWTLGAVNLLGEAPGSLDAYHHLDASLLLTTTHTRDKHSCNWEASSLVSPYLKLVIKKGDKRLICGAIFIREA